jgi:hypothetical protein
LLVALTTVLLKLQQQPAIKPIDHLFGFLI